MTFKFTLSHPDDTGLFTVSRPASRYEGSDLHTNSGVHFEVRGYVCTLLINIWTLASLYLNLFYNF